MKSNYQYQKFLIIICLMLSGCLLSPNAINPSIETLMVPSAVTVAVMQTSPPPPTLQPTFSKTPSSTNTSTPINGGEFDDKLFSLVKTYGFAANSFALSPTNKNIAINQTEYIEIRDTDTGNLILEIPKPWAGIVIEGPINYSENGEFLAAAVTIEGDKGTEGGVYVWETGDNQPLFQFSALDFDIRRLAFSSTAKFLAVTIPGETSEQVIVWDMETGEKYCSVNLIALDVSFLSGTLLFATAELILSDENVSAVRIWNLDTTTHMCKLETELFLSPADAAKQYKATSISVSNDARFLAAIVDEKLRIWDFSQNLEIPGPLLSVSALISQVIFSPHGELAILDEQGNITLLEPISWRNIGGFQVSGATKILFNFDGTRLFVGGKVFQIWQILYNSTE